MSRDAATQQVSSTEDTKDLAGQVAEAGGREGDDEDQAVFFGGPSQVG